MAEVSDVAVTTATESADDGASADVLMDASLQHESAQQVRQADLEEGPPKLDEHVLFDANATEDSDSPVGEAAHWVETLMAELDTSSAPYPESIESHVTPTVTATSTRTDSSNGPPGAGTGLFDDPEGVEPIPTPDSAQKKDLGSGVPAVQFFYLDEVSSVSTTSEPAVAEGRKGSALLWFIPEAAGATKAIDSLMAAVNSKASRLRRKARKAVVAESPMVAKDVREDEDAGFTDEDSKRIADKLRSSWFVLLGRSGGSRSKGVDSGSLAKPTENSGSMAKLDGEVAEDVYLLSDKDVDDIAARIRAAQPEPGLVTVPADGKETDTSTGRTVFDALMSAMSTKAHFLRRKMHTIVVVELPHMTENARDLAAGVRHRAELAERDIVRVGSKLRERCLVLSGVSTGGVARAEDADAANTELANKLAVISRRRKDLDAFTAAVSDKAKFIRSKGRTTILAPLLRHDAQEVGGNVDEGAETESGQPERLQSRLKHHWLVLFSGKGEHVLPVDVETADACHGDKDSSKATMAKVGSRSMRAIKTDLAAKREMSKALAQKMWQEVCKTKQDAVDDMRHGVDDFRQNIDEIRRALREIVSSTSEGGNRQVDTAEPSISMVSPPREISTSPCTSSMGVCLEVQVEGVAESASSGGSAPVTPTELQSQKDSGFLQQAICAASTRAGSEANSEDVEDVVSVKSGEVGSIGLDQVESDGVRDVAVA